MKQVFAAVLCLLILFPFVVNLIGWNLYAYLRIGNKDLIFAAANGVSHHALADHRDAADIGSSYGIELPVEMRTLLSVGPLEIFAETRLGTMEPFAFRVLTPSEYSFYLGLEFPWLLLLVVPALIYFVTLK